MSMFTANSRLNAVDVVEDDNYLGKQAYFQDFDYWTDGDNPFLKSCSIVKAIYVKNTSSATLAGGTGCTWETNNVGKAVGALSGANLVCDGVVPYGISVPVDSYFWLIVEGPTKVRAGVGGTTEGIMIQTLAIGEFGIATPGTNPIGHSGMAVETVAEDAYARCFINNPFSGVKF